MSLHGPINQTSRIVWYNFKHTFFLSSFSVLHILLTPWSFVCNENLVAVQLNLFLLA
jgi:hypothetical protein